MQYRCPRFSLLRSIILPFFASFVVLPSEAALSGLGYVIPSSLKKFAVNGAVLPQEAGRYFLLPLYTTALVDHMEAGRFVMLYGPLGSSKTSLAFQALVRVTYFYGSHYLVVDMQAITLTSTPTAFWRNLSTILSGEAEQQGLQLARFGDADSFQAALLASKLRGARVVLMVDEFDMLDHATPGIKDEFLGALRAIQQERVRYAIQSVVAVGPFSTLFMDRASASPFSFDESVRVPFFTREQVHELLGQLAQAKLLALEEGIADDIYQYTSGHAGLVSVCGRELESNPQLRSERRRVTLTAWKDYRTRSLLAAARGWSTVDRMATSVWAMPPGARKLLAKAAMADSSSVLNAELETDRGHARYLAAEGWLTPIGDPNGDVHKVTSPFCHELARAELSRRDASDITSVSLKDDAKEGRCSYRADD
jgi:hypothetical protein